MKRLLIGLLVVLAGVTTGFAAGTAAGTQIDNSATLSYSVGGVAQADITSNTDTFVVDRKLDVLVTHQDAAAVSVVPGQTAAVLTFTVQNQGNDTQDFSLSSVANDGNPFGLTDTIDATNVQIFVDSNNNGTYDAGTDTATFIDELAPDATISVFIVADIPSTAVDGDVAEYTLVAQVAEGGASGTQGADITTDDSGTADDPATVQNVFADGAGSNGATDAQYNGKHADNDAYQVNSANLTVTKGSCVIWDPVNTTTNPKRIPSGVVRYTIEVANSGSADATNVTLSDTLNGNLTFGTTAPAPTAVAEVRDTACDCANPAGNVITADTVTESGGTVTVNYNTVGANGTTGNNSATKCAYFDVTIN